jgi:hypothetical protein
LPQLRGLQCCGEANLVLKRAVRAPFKKLIGHSIGYTTEAKKGFATLRGEAE